MGDNVQGNASATIRKHPPFAQPGLGRAAPAADTGWEMPSIENFLDELPSIDDYVWAGDSEADDMRSIDDYLEDSSAGVLETSDAPPATEFDDDGWAIADWQSFDWNGAASLGSRTDASPSRDAMNRSSSTRDRGVGERSRPSEITPSADEVARALDGIAQRIRSGELKIDQLTGAPPEAAMAAALASLLRMRD